MKLSLNFKISNLKSQEGQTMLLTVMILSGAIISATAVIGLLMIYEVRNTTDVISSAKALYAAESGLECALLKNREGSERNCGTEDEPIVLDDSRARYSVEILTDESGNPISILSTGVFNEVARSFEASY